MKVLRNSNKSSKKREESEDHTSSTSSTVPKEISVATAEESSWSGKANSNFARDKMRSTTGAKDIGDRLYQQGKESAKRKQENAARMVDHNETFAPKLVAKQSQSASMQRSSPFQRLYSLARMKQSLQRKRIEGPPASPQLKRSHGSNNSSSSKKIVFSTKKAAELYERGMRSKEETKARNLAIASSLEPCFTPTKFTNRTAPPTTPRTPHAGNRLYEQRRDKPTTPLHPSSQDKDCTFKPDISKSQRQHPSPVTSPVFQRLRQTTTPLHSSAQENDCTFKPDITKSQRHHPSTLSSPIFQRLQQEGNSAAQKRMQEWNDTRTKELSPPTRKSVNKAGPRIDNLYNIGLNKGKSRRTSDKEEREARDRKKEDEELAQCTFQPKTRWTDVDNYVEEDTIPLEIETHLTLGTIGTGEEVSQLDVDGSTFDGGDNEIIFEQQQQQQQQIHVNTNGDDCPKQVGLEIDTSAAPITDKDIIGCGVGEMEENDSIECGSI